MKLAYLDRSTKYSLFYLLVNTKPIFEIELDLTNKIKRKDIFYSYLNRIYYLVI